MGWSFSLDVIRLLDQGQCFDFVSRVDPYGHNHRVYLLLFEMMSNTALNRV